MNRILKNVWSLVLVVSLVGLSACKKDDPQPVNENDYVNSWVLDKMKEAYYWTDKLPTLPNKVQKPDLFFKSLLATPDDRFSWIQENYQDLLNSLQGVSKEAGYEFALYKESQSNNNVIALILYIKKGSPAESVGLSRGDIIQQINGQQLTIDNYQTVLSKIGEDHTISFRPYQISSNSFGASKTISIKAVEYAENPNFLDKVITVNNRKVGYYVYNLFATGPTSGNNQYNDEMDAVFGRFKDAGITDLVLDLRFNSGGAEAATVNLASLIGKGIDATKVFAKRQYNTTLTNQILNDPTLGSNFMLTKFTNKTQNVGSLLKNNRVYILTSHRSASASELLINGLKPYMDVFLIGDKTYGKNVGSISIFKANDPKNTWGMQPIVVKSFNSLDQSDYSSGFTPNISDLDNAEQLPLGDSKEKLLGLALNHISTSGGRIETTKSTMGESLGSSFDFKVRNKELVVESKDLF
jgi:carboxyl-terminal processing protease